MALSLEDPQTDRPAGYLVLSRQADGSWREVGEVARQPGLTARTSRRRAIEQATGSRAPIGDFAVLPLSEWTVARDCTFPA